MAGYGKNVLLDIVEALEHLPAATIDTTTQRFLQIAEEEATRAGRRAMTIGGKSYPLTAQLKSVSATTTTATMTFLGIPVGFWVWAEEGTRGHMIRPRRRFADSDKGMYRAAMKGGLGHPVTAEVHHPGTHGRAAWTHACDRMDDEMGEVVDEAANNLDLWG